MKPIAQSSLLGIPIPFIILMILVAVCFIFSRFTYIGRQIYAVGGNNEAASIAEAGRILDLAGFEPRRDRALYLADHANGTRQLVYKRNVATVSDDDPRRDRRNVRTATPSS